MGPRGKTQRESFNYFHDFMRQIEWDLHQEVLDAKRVPKEWHAMRGRVHRPSRRALPCGCAATDVADLPDDWHEGGRSRRVQVWSRTKFWISKTE